MAKQVQCPSCGMHMDGPCSHPRCPLRKPTIAAYVALPDDASSSDVAEAFAELIKKQK